MQNISPFVSSNNMLHSDKHILCASSSDYKIQEIRSIIPELAFFAPKDVALVCHPEETGSTFLENALIKARAYYDALIKSSAYTRSRLVPTIVLAEDSGLCVDALDGSPGIYSARYGVKDAQYNEKDKLYQCKKILFEMQSASMRSARFICCAVLMWNTLEFTVYQATWEGEIIEGLPRGVHGFGYDPVFYLPEHRCTSAELSLQQKSQLSHRAQAMRGLLPTMISCVK